ncbi:hypothetical protein J1N35_037627 [Gossypium stocksii]|uniref:Aminotransferase-like plant mobile domain-containing protein n=1 Tax=Gossypium stocksii TaxID=47602 RepID=A0A9D3UKH2_9ROSI|nr:hypothetical protein J1N35_037627 [Gossypium stocksii]
MGRISWDLLKELEDIRLLLDQHLEVEFEWMPYADSDIISCISTEALDNRGMWDTKVSLIVYAMVEMQESNQVIQQFGWRKQIPLPPQDLKELHKVGMRGKNDEDWYIFQATDIPRILHPNADVDADPNVRPDANASPLPMMTLMQMLMLVSMPKSMPMYPGFFAPYGYMSIVTQTPPASLFYRGRSSAQSFTDGVEDTQWEARITLHSSREESDGDEGELKINTNTKTKTKMNTMTKMETEMSKRVGLKPMISWMMATRKFIGMHLWLYAEILLTSIVYCPTAHILPYDTIDVTYWDTMQVHGQCQLEWHTGHWQPHIFIWDMWEFGTPYSIHVF